MTNQALSVALVGAGDIAQTAHLPAWRDTGQHVRWVVDKDPDRAAGLARQWGIEHWSTNLSDPLDDERVDVVDLCTPGTLHATQAIEVLEADKDLLIEKPVTLTLKDLQHIEELRQARKRTVMVAENWPYATVTTAAMEALGAGEIGEIIQLQASHESNLRLTRPAGAGIGDRDSLGYFFTAGIHTVNLSRHLVADFDQVHAFAVNAKDGPYYPVEDDLVLSSVFESGAVGAFNFTGRSRHLGPRRLLFRLIGESGVIEFDVWAGWLEVTARGVRTRRDFDDASVGYREEVAHFVDCLAAGREPLTSSRQQIGTLATVVAAYRSVTTTMPTVVSDLLQ